MSESLIANSTFTFDTRIQFYDSMGSGAIIADSNEPILGNHLDYDLDPELVYNNGVLVKAIFISRAGYGDARIPEQADYRIHVELNGMTVIGVSLIASNDDEFVQSTWAGFSATPDLSSNFSNFELLEGDDYIIGNIFDDYICSGAGNDLIEGAAGNDSLEGGEGNDTLEGGDGADTFVFRPGFGNDIITDFNKTEDALVFFDASGALLDISQLTETQNGEGHVVLTSADGSSVALKGINQVGILESLTSENTSTIVSPHEYADNFTITSSFGSSVYEGTLSGAEEGSGNQISFTINQIDPQIRSVYVALKPASGQTTDFWKIIPSVTPYGKTVGEPADQLALSQFKWIDGVNPLSFVYFLNADNAVEDNETFVFSVYENIMDFALGRKAIKSFEFSVLDDDATLTFSSDLYDRSGEDISGFQLSSSSGSATETYVTNGTGMFEWSSTPGATVEFASATAYSNSSKAVTSADALDALKLSVGLTPSNGAPTAYDYIAADFNRDGKVTSSDALDILKYAVGLEVERDAEWVFIRSDEDLTAVGKNNVEYDANIEIEDITSDAEIGLIGILIGDVNDSYSGMIT